MKLVPTDFHPIADPNDIYYEGAVTFIHTPDGTILAEMYPETHEDIIYNNKETKNYSHFDIRQNDYVLGRMMTVLPEDERFDVEQKTTIIAMHGIPPLDNDDDDYSYRQYEPVDAEKAKQVVEKLVKTFPSFYYGNVHVICYPKEDYTVEGIENKNRSSSKVQNDSPECDRLGVDIDGQEMSIKQILANLHMVRGDQFEKIKHGFCPQANSLSQKTKDNCPQHRKLISYINRTLKCGQDDYQNILNQGKQGYRQQLKNVFGNPDAMDSEFRTQKDMDKAWDFYRKAESVMGFEQWMKLRENESTIR